MPALSVIIPTHDRPAALRRTLLAVADQDEVPGGCEVLVVENGARGRAEEVVTEVREVVAGTTELRLLHEPTAGPAAARNCGIAAAQSALLLLLGDDTPPLDRRLFVGHTEAHADLGGRRAAILGQITWADGSPSPLMRWLETGGMQFHFGSLKPGPVDPERHFYSSHVSLATATIRAAGAFDRRFDTAAMEDLELGRRLKRSGLELIYHPELVVGHDHPTSYEQSLRRMARVGSAAATMSVIHPDVAVVSAGRTAALKMALVRAASRLVLGGRELSMLPTPVRELRWRIAHLDAFYRGYRASIADR